MQILKGSWKQSWTEMKINLFPSLVPRPLPDFHSCKGSGLGTRLPLFYISDHKTSATWLKHTSTCSMFSLVSTNCCYHFSRRGDGSVKIEVESQMRKLGEANADFYKIGEIGHLYKMQTQYVKWHSCGKVGHLWASVGIEREMVLASSHPLPLPAFISHCRQ